MPAPTNDNFANAQDLASATSGSLTPITIDLATTEVGEPTGLTLGGIFQSIWFKWTCPVGFINDIEFDTNGSPTSDPGSQGPDGFLDTTLAIWEGTTLTGLTEVTSNDDASPSTYTSKCQFTPVPGTTYYIQAGTFDNGYIGQIKLNWSTVVVPRASLGHLLATAAITGRPATSTITCNANQNGTLYLFWLTSLISTSSTQSLITAISDSKGGTWAISPSGNLPIIGPVDAFYLSSPNRTDFVIGSFVRTSGPNLVTGDTITLTYSAPNPDYINIIAQCIVGSTDLAVAQKQGAYNTLVNISSGSFISFNNGLANGSTLLWRVEYAGFNLNPANALDAAFIGLYSCYGGSGFIPDEVGSNVVEVTNGPLTLSLVFATRLKANGITIEPGGSWLVAPLSQAQSGNYQFIGLSGVTPPPPSPSIFWFYRDGQWRQQNMDTAHSLYFFKNGQWRTPTDDSFTLNGRLTNSWQQ